jgi:hypothetical protein
MFFSDYSSSFQLTKHFKANRPERLSSREIVAQVCTDGPFRAASPLAGGPVFDRFIPGS